MAGKKNSRFGNGAIGRTPPGTPTIAERWKAAREAGEKTFDPGVACVNGHASPRWANNGICIPCKRDRDNAYNAAHKEEHLARSLKSAANRKAEIVEYRKQYYRDNIETAKERSREWELAHPERVRKRRRDWHHKNRDRLNAKGRAYHAANPEKKRASGRKWKQANKHKVREADNKRRAIEIGAQVGDRQAYRRILKVLRSAPRIACYWCKEATRPGHRHIDHIIPLAKGGADAVENLCVSCPPCNLRKNAKMPEDFNGQSELRFA